MFNRPVFSLSCLSNCIICNYIIACCLPPQSSLTQALGAFLLFWNVFVGRPGAICESNFPRYELNHAISTLTGVFRHNITAIARTSTKEDFLINNNNNNNRSTGAKACWPNITRFEPVSLTKCSYSSNFNKKKIKTQKEKKITRKTISKEVRLDTQGWHTLLRINEHKPWSIYTYNARKRGSRGNELISERGRERQLTCDPEEMHRKD